MQINEKKIKIINENVPKEMLKLVSIVKEKYPDNEKLVRMFEKGLVNTYQTTINKDDNGETFIITGDIPAMWNRDSVAQVRPLLLVANESEEIKNILRGIIQIHKKQIMIDPYANAFNRTPGSVGDHCDDLTHMDPMVWERKYEIDSLCYPIQLAYFYWKVTGDTTIFDTQFNQMVNQIINTFMIEQHHHEKSPYSFRRIADWLLFEEPARLEFESLNNNGKGAPVGYTGMTWSGFRPSDDACKYGYLVPANMFAVVILGYLEEIYGEFYNNNEQLKVITKLKNEINNGIETYGITDHPDYGKMYAYEVDGLGKTHLMDDANVPSLLSACYLGYCGVNDEVYQNTRRFILSKDNPYFYEGKVAKGVGSPHTPPEYIWHIALAIQGMTTESLEEKQEIMDTFLKSDAGTDLMHEGFHVDNPDNFTRPWFSWANSMFAEFVLNTIDMKVIDEVKK